MIDKSLKPLGSPPSRKPAEGMLRRFCPFHVVLICSIFVLILFVSHRLVKTNNVEFSVFQQGWSINDASLDGLPSKQKEFFSMDNITAEIQFVINEQRKIVAQEMTDYSFPNGLYNISAKKLADLVPELGGQPLRSVIVTTWRSGSTFLGDVLNSHPANYYHYEPLLDYDIIQIRGPPHADSALSVLKNLLNCDYSSLDRYLTYGQEHTWLFNHNTRLWEQCLMHPQICWLPEFLNPFCRLFPFQSMKIVRLRLNLIEDLLADPSLNIRVLYLVRDPRGTLQSRKHRDWCPNNADCASAALLCADLVADFAAVVRLTEKYPNRFTAMRYEDLSLQPQETVRRLFTFFGLDFHANVSAFLDTHTKIDVGGVSSTFRNSKSAPFHWRQDLSYREVQKIQDACKSAMKHWGYIKATSKLHQLKFNPIRNFSLALP